MKVRIDARIDPDLLAEVKEQVPAAAKTMTEAVEAGLRLWLRSLRRAKPKG